jgi:hypothetical protein
MAIRPTVMWRAKIQDEATAVAGGTLAADHAYAAQVWSDYLLTHTDAVLEDFEVAVARLRDPSDSEIMAEVKKVVLALNKVSEELYDRGAFPYETDEREALCTYIDQTLEDAGVDLEALTGRLGIGRMGITDEWRDW